MNIFNLTQQNIMFGYIFILISLCYTINCGYINENHNPSCHKLVKTTLQYTGTYSPYSFEDRNWKYTPEGCTAEKIWYFGRHGSRTPQKSDITYMKSKLPPLLIAILKNYKGNRGYLCAEELRNLKSWFPNPELNVDMEKTLVEQGRKELFAIATRYKTRFPDLFPDAFNNQSYLLQYRFTKDERAKASADAFSEGLFGKEGALNVWYAPSEMGDPVMEFSENCTKWQAEVNKNPSARVEKARFEKSIYMKKTIGKVSNRLGFLKNMTLKEVDMIYITCYFETEWTGGKSISPWCAAFDEEDFRVMHFWKDLENYWINGYGFGINYEQACGPIKDVVHFFDQFNSSRRVTGYFTNLETTVKVLSRLGLFMEYRPLLASQYETQKERRQWDTSRVQPMSSNMVFVLYSCPNIRDKQIGFYFQEKPTQLPACRDQWICPYKEFKTYFADIISNCDLGEICKQKPKNIFSSI